MVFVSVLITVPPPGEEKYVVYWVHRPPGNRYFVGPRIDFGASFLTLLKGRPRCSPETGKPREPDRSPGYTI